MQYKGTLPASDMLKLPDPDKALIRDLKKIWSGRGILPRAVDGEIQALLGELDLIQPWMLADDDDALLSRDHGVLLYELDDVKDVL